MASKQSMPQWQSDGVGSFARIGVLTPAFDPVPESEMWAMAPRGVSIHASRVRWNGDMRSFSQPPHVDTATELLAGLALQVILYAFTGSSYLLGAEEDDTLRTRLEKCARGVPVILTAVAASEALQLMGVRRLALIHPPWFAEEVSAKGKDYFQKRGMEVVFCARMTPRRNFTEVPPTEVFDWAKANVPREAEAVFIGGNGLRAIGVIQALEESLGMTVLTGNQVAFWQALRLVGMKSEVSQHGRIFTESAAQ